MTTDSLRQRSVNTIRTLSIDAIQQANSGHPGMPMGMADVAYVLWTQFLRHNPKNPDWVNRDRFILSAGHGSMLLYSLLYLTGYDVPLSELKRFRQWNSLTPGHPEYGLTPGVETTTGPLGQGFANGVGMAIAEAFLAETFNQDDHTLIDHHTYALVSDGDMMEGVTQEAASLAGHLQLGKLIYLYDDNGITIDGPTELSFSENTAQRFTALGWHVQTIDGHDHSAITEAIRQAKAETEQPSLIICQTTIGYGSPNQAGTAKIHGSPLGDAEIQATKTAFGFDPEAKFAVQDDVLAHFREAVTQGEKIQAEWQAQQKTYAQAHPKLAAQLRSALADELPENWLASLPSFSPADGPIATRAVSGKVLNAIAPAIPNLIGGSADLAPSNNTWLNDQGVFGKDSFAGRNFHFGVREHGMTAILNGMALHGGVIPYGGTFLAFSDYSRPAIRLAALSKIPSIFVFTHDSVGLGEDGPTHQPVEQLTALRAIPNLTVIRPADANETSIAWKVALEKRDGPVALLFSRQKLPVFNRSRMNPARGLERGAYVLLDSNRVYPDVLLLASGAEVTLAIGAQVRLAQQGIGARVISMPSWELFAQQSETYRDSVLPPGVKARVAIEAGVSLAWHRWVGPEGHILGLDRFGASAPYQDIYDQFGFTVENVVLRALAAIDQSKK